MSLTFLVAFAAACIAGTFFDYVIHRWLAHGPLAARESGSLTRHAWVHHMVFTDRRGMTAARKTARRGHVHLSLRSLVMLLPVLLAASAAAGLFVAGNIEGAPLMGGALAAGLLTSLIAYDLLHWMHHAELPRLVAGMPGYKQLRAWHHEHHREPESRYATLLPLWDFLFFTHRAPEVIALAPESKPADTRQAKSRRPATREQAETRMQTMMARAAARAETHMDADEAAPKRRGLFGGGGDTEAPEKRDAATRKRGVTDNQRAVNAAAKADEAARTAAPAKAPRARRAGQRRGAKTTADWLASIEIPADIDIQVTAVKEEDE